MWKVQTPDFKNFANASAVCVLEGGTKPADNGLVVWVVAHMDLRTNRYVPVCFMANASQFFDWTRVITLHFQTT